jgi:hypothetical protein
MRRASKSLFSDLLVTIFAIALCMACNGGNGGTCGDCLLGTICCNDGLCHECCIDDDCLGHPGVTGCPDHRISCNQSYECECICLNAGEDCSRYPGDCCDSFACDVFTNTCMTECLSDADCLARTEIPFHEDLKCDNGVCDFDHCTTDADCPGGRVCFGGDCVTIPSCTDLSECVVLPENAVTRQSTTIQFAATAYLDSGSVAPGIAFEWSSTEPNAASVGAAGLVTGGASTGGATITATVSGCPTVTCSAAVTNYGPVIQTRVVVVDELEYTPIEGATVVVGAETEWLYLLKASLPQT